MNNEADRNDDIDHELIVDVLNNDNEAIVRSAIDDARIPSHQTAHLLSYKDQARSHPFSNIDMNYNNKQQGDCYNNNSTDTTGTIIPIAEAIFATSTAGDIERVSTSTIYTSSIPPPPAATTTTHHSNNLDRITDDVVVTKPRWTCTRSSLRITILVVVIVIVAAGIPSVLLCGDGNCRTTPTSSTTNSNNNSSNNINNGYFEDDLVTLQSAVDEYYAALSSIGIVDGVDTDVIPKELLNVTVIRQYGYPISSWDVSRVTNFTSVFDGKRNERLILSFNEDLGHWNVSAGIDMFRMFGKLNVYEGYGLEQWDVSNVVNMRGMFQEGYQFRGNVSFWDTRKVKTLTRLFSDCYIFNTDISTWKTSNVDSMAWMVCKHSLHFTLIICIDMRSNLRFHAFYCPVL